MGLPNKSVTPGANASNPFIIYGRMYSCASGSSISIMGEDANVLINHGWIEVPAALNLVGTAGPTGPTGPRGLTGAAGGVLSIAYMVDSSHILASNSSPVVIIPATVGKTIVVLSAEFDYTFVTADYSSGSNPFGLYYNGLTPSVSNGLAVVSSGWPSGGISEVFQVTNSNPILLGETGAVNTAVVFATVTADPTVGAGSLLVTALYQLV